MLDIIGKRMWYFGLSGLLMIASIIALTIFGLKPSIDFAGGSLVELSFSGTRPELSQLQAVVDELNYGTSILQPADEVGYIIKLPYLSEMQHQELLLNIREAFATETTTVTEERVETIGPAVSSHLQQRAWQTGLAVVVAIVLYIAYAFRKVSKPVQSWKYGLTAIVALLHDVLITAGVFALLGHFYGVEVGIPFVVALLTILGYSVNDTIVVFDRIREELVKRHHGGDFTDTVNRGVNATLIRSLNMSITTLLVLFGLYFFGGESIHYFSLALIIGIAAGTYSSIFLASPLLVEWKRLSK